MKSALPLPFAGALTRPHLVLVGEYRAPEGREDEINLDCHEGIGCGDIDPKAPIAPRLLVAGSGTAWLRKRGLSTGTIAPSDCQNAG